MSGVSGSPSPSNNNQAIFLCLVLGFRIEFYLEKKSSEAKDWTPLLTRGSDLLQMPLAHGSELSQMPWGTCEAVTCCPGHVCTCTNIQF